MKSKLVVYENYILNRAPLTCVGAWAYHQDYWKKAFTTFSNRGGCSKGCSKHCPMYDQEKIQEVIGELSIN